MTAKEEKLFRESVISKGSFLSRFFEVDITIKVFGHVIWAYHYPPQKEIES